MTEMPTPETPDAAEWVRAHGSVVGFPMTCKTDPRVRHPLVRFDRQRYNAQMAVFRASKPTKFLAAPDVVHMLVGDRKSAATLGHTLVCDPSLEPGAIVRARKR